MLLEADGYFPRVWLSRFEVNAIIPMVNVILLIITCTFVLICAIGPTVRKMKYFTEYWKKILYLQTSKITYFVSI